MRKEGFRAAVETRNHSVVEEVGRGEVIGGGEGSRRMLMDSGRQKEEEGRGGNLALSRKCWICRDREKEKK